LQKVPIPIKKHAGYAASLVIPSRLRQDLMNLGVREYANAGTYINHRYKLLDRSHHGLHLLFEISARNRKSL